MADEPDQHYQPWLRDSGGATPPAPAPRGGSAAPVPSARPQPATGPSRRDVRALSADELLARPAPLPTDAEAEPGAGERLREGLGKIGAGLRAANERLEPARRLRAAGAATAKTAGAALRRTGKAVGALSSATAQAATQAAEAAAPRIQEATEAALSGLNKTAAGARERIGKGSKAARARLQSGSASVRDTARRATSEGAGTQTPPSELERLVEREQLDDGAKRAGGAATAAGSGLPLFGAPAPDATIGVPQRAATTGAAAPEAVVAAVTAVPPSAPPAEMLQAETDMPAVTPRREGADISSGGSGGGGSGMTWSAGALQDWARHPATWALAAIALVASGFAIGRWTSGTGMSEAVLGEAIDAHLLANPEIVPAAMERLQANQQAQAIGQRRAALTTPFSGAWAGNAGGDVTMVVFTDYACTFCRASAADIERLLRTDPDLKIVFRELPILSAESEAAARVALAAARRGRYMAVHRMLFRAQVPDAAARTNALAGTGLTLAEGATQEAAIDRELSANIQLARALGIDGTPAFVIGDRLLVGAVGYDRLREAITAARD